jgi:predicted DNA-binding transcriptional regulator AlpA
MDPVMTAAEARVIGLLEQILFELRRERDPEQAALMNATETAAALGVHRRTLHRMRQEPNFPKPIKVGTSRRWKRSDVERFMRARRA